jgi:hypothetical protein
MMDRCRDCNSTLKPDETVCFTCGSMRQMKSPGASALQRFAVAVKIGFIASGVLTVVSLFWDATPSFLKCLATTMILLFVNRSAEQMIEKKHG